MQDIEERKPSGQTFDAVVGLMPSAAPSNEAFALVKCTFEISGNRLLPSTPEIIKYDFNNPDQTPMLVPGTDYWPIKQSTDVVVRGSSFAPDSRGVEHMEVSLQIGKVMKRIAVFGRRLIKWDAAGKMSISEAEPFSEMPLNYENAYGGIDWRVGAEPDDPNILGVTMEIDYPGLYPRNPFGKGYLVSSDIIDDEIEMPNLEDADDLLTVERLAVGDPRFWYRQPLPWCYEWIQPLMFPRYVFFMPGVDAWFPGPEDESLPEVKRGYVPAGFRSAMDTRTLGDGMNPLFYQEASHGLVLSEVADGETVVLKGMHPLHEILSFTLPESKPFIEIAFEGKREAVKPRVHSIVFYPNDLKVTILYGAGRDLPRIVVPRVHKYIPLSVYVNGEGPVEYKAPQTVVDRLKEALKKGKSL